MLRYALKRLLAALLVLAVTSLVVFLVIWLSPNDPVRIRLGLSAGEAEIRAMRAELGLDQPFFTQYLAWLGQIAQGDFGRSISNSTTVAAIVGPAYVNTLILALASLAVSLVFGVTAGIVAGFNPGRLVDRVLMFLSEILAATPVFWLAIILIWIFARQLDWLPSSGMRNMRAKPSFGDLLAHLVLPAIAASVLAIAIIARMVRANVIEVLASDYVKISRAAGMGPFRIFGAHVWRNILGPVITVGGLQFGTLFAGVIFVESVFAWPGISAQLFNAITAGDVAVVQTGVLMIAATFILTNLTVDLLLRWLNPRKPAT